MHPLCYRLCKKKLGTGGVLRKGGSIIEVQGEHHLEKIKNFCLNSNCVVGATKQNKAAAASVSHKRKSIDTNSEKNAATATKAVTSGNVRPLTSKEIKTMKPTEMKEHLAARDLSTQGNKKELIARLMSSL
mmetsp:Transcript_28927/g.33080  ORF Transcript_28927/g.33080 Transcript_28927/m.33080 type:complete len:131 (-) Transcript_28927:285-677(-)